MDKYASERTGVSGEYGSMVEKSLLHDNDLGAIVSKAAKEREFYYHEEPNTMNVYVYIQ